MSATKIARKHKLISNIVNNYECKKTAASNTLKLENIIESWYYSEPHHIR